MTSIKKNNIMLLFFVYFFYSIAFSQKIQKDATHTIISGIVKNKDGNPLPDISVNLISAKDTTIIAYSFTDETGSYLLKTKSRLPSFLISISAFDVKEEMKKIENKTQNVDFIATMEMIQLEEVMVKAKKNMGAERYGKLFSSCF